jgi:hypothetical protein
MRPFHRHQEQEGDSESLRPSLLEGVGKEQGDTTEMHGHGRKGSWFPLRPKKFKTDSEGKKKYDSSLLKALHRTFFFTWWTAGILKLIAGTFSFM